jgi:hypothetical protein
VDIERKFLMARFTYKCDRCGNIEKVSLDKRLPSWPCMRNLSPPHSTTVAVCGGTGKPVFAVGSTKVMERLDNGAMPRAVERIHNIEEITAADADAHSAIPENDDA